MPRMSDEAYEYIQDCKEKKIVGNNARNRRGRNGKGGKMKTASDYMTNKQLRALNSEARTYRMGSPMNWAEFSTMPDDLKKMYIKNLRKKFNVPDEELALSMGVDIQKFEGCLNSIKLNPRTCEDRSWYDTDDHGRFRTWWIVTKEEK